MGVLWQDDPLDGAKDGKVVAKFLLLDLWMQIPDVDCARVFLVLPLKTAKIRDAAFSDFGIFGFWR